MRDEHLKLSTISLVTHFPIFIRKFQIIPMVINHTFSKNLTEMQVRDSYREVQNIDTELEV